MGYQKILTPAYGRDYKTAEEAIKGYFSGVDWILHDMSSPWDGKPCSCRDFPDEEVKLRFNRREDFTFATWRPSAPIGTPSAAKYEGV